MVALLLVLLQALTPPVASPATSSATSGYVPLLYLKLLPFGVNLALFVSEGFAVGACCTVLLFMCKQFVLNAC